MENRITTRMGDLSEMQNCRSTDAHPISEILEELLAQYQARFPGFHVAIVETPVNAL